MRPRCWGIGLGRTGTTSLCDALTLLGYQRVQHNPRFEELKDLEAGADIGVAIFFKYLDYKFPDSKFVLTVRPLEPWLASIEYMANKAPVRSREEDIPILRRMLLYEDVAFDREKFAASYERHHADVRRYFAKRPSDLLEMDLVGGEGWDTLCPFLGLPVPTAPFPRLNART